MFSASCVQECVCLFSKPPPLLLCALQCLGVIPSGCQKPSWMEAVSRAMGALISWKPAPRMTSDFVLRLISSISVYFADLRANINEHTESVTSGRWRKYLVQSRDKYAEFSPSFLVAFWWCCLWGAVFYSGSSRSKGGKMSCKWGQVCERLQSKCALYSTISRTDGTGVYKIR